MHKNIIGVKYKSIYNPKWFDGRMYSYYTNLPVKVGDLVLAPTDYGEKIARVSETNIPEHMLKFDISKLKSIEKKIDKYKYLKSNGNIINVA